MLTTLALFALTLAADPVPADVLHAEANVALATDLQRSCWTPSECVVADELLAAARIERDAAEALHAVAIHPADPWQPTEYVEPFADMDLVPEATAAQAAFEIAGLQNDLDSLGQP